MITKTNKIRFTLMICLLTTLACNLTSPDSSTDSSSGQPTEVVVIEDLCDNNLYPVKQNATWTYFNTGGPSGDFTYTDTITEIRSDGFTLTTQFDDLTRTQEWACETGGLKSLSYNSGASASIETQGVTSEFTTLEITGVSLPKEIISGMQWLYSIKVEGVTTLADGQQTRQTATYTVTIQEMGAETITVPAGTFQAIKFQANSTIDILPQGAQSPITITGTTTTWYVAGVGQAKSVGTLDFGSGPFTLTTELQSYNIP